MAGLVSSRAERIGTSRFALARPVRRPVGSASPEPWMKARLTLPSRTLIRQTFPPIER